MKKQWRTTMIMAAVLAALLAVLVLSKALPGSAAATTATTAATTALPTVFSTDAADVSSIQISNQYGGYTLLPAQITGDDGTTSISWSAGGLSDYPLSSTTLNDAAAACLNIKAGKAIAAGVTDLTPYGLDKPKTMLSVILKNGEKHTVSFGNEIASGNYDYAVLDNSGNIFTVSTATTAVMAYKLTDLLDKSQVIGIEEADLTGLTFERAKDALRLVTTCEYVSRTAADGTTTSSLYFAVHEPIEQPGNDDTLTTLANQTLGITVTDYIEMKPTDLAQYGLDQPRYTLTLTSANKTVSLRIGKKADDSSCYMISDAVPAVFTAPIDTFSKLDMSFTETIDCLVAPENIWQTDQIKVNLPGAVFTADISMTKDQKASEDGVVFKLDGDNANIFNQNSASLFTEFYQRIIAVKIAGEDAAAVPDNTRDGSITYYLKADTEKNTAACTKVIEFAKRDDYTYYVFIDGVYAGYYIDGETAFRSNETDYEGIIFAYKKMKYAMEHAVDGVFNTEEGYQLD